MICRLNDSTSGSYSTCSVRKACCLIRLISHIRSGSLQGVRLGIASSILIGLTWRRSFPPEAMWQWFVADCGIVFLKRRYTTCCETWNEICLLALSIRPISASPSGRQCSTIRKRPQRCSTDLCTIAISSRPETTATASAIQQHNWRKELVNGNKIRP